jgi:hypothetical protein
MNTMDCYDEAFEVVITKMVQLKEESPTSENVQWSESEIARIRYGFGCMSEEQRAKFLDRFKGYKIVKLLTEK